MCPLSITQAQRHSSSPTTPQSALPQYISVCLKDYEMKRGQHCRWLATLFWAATVLTSTNEQPQVFANQSLPTKVLLEFRIPFGMPQCELHLAVAAMCRPRYYLDFPYLWPNSSLLPRSRLTSIVLTSRVRTGQHALLCAPISTARKYLSLIELCSAS